MTKHFLIEQPPLSEKYRLLVDDINENGEFAITEDLEKVIYNREVLGSDFSSNFSIYSALSNDGVTTVLPLGRFITIWQISKNESSQRIWFFDYENELSASFRKVGKENMDGYFSENIYAEFEKIHAMMISTFNKKSDLFELVLPVE